VIADNIRGEAVKFKQLYISAIAGNILKETCANFKTAKMDIRTRENRLPITRRQEERSQAEKKNNAWANIKKRTWDMMTTFVN
jgi:hypothetical protein